MAPADARLPVTELLASLSLATDLGTGQPLGHGLSTSLLAVAVANELGCHPEQVRHVQQVALIRFLGCTSDASDTARMAGGDELAFMRAFAPAHLGNTTEALRAMVGAVGAGQPIHRRARLIAAAVVNPVSDSGGLAAHCEVGAMLARRLGLDHEVIAALDHAYERWDGSGEPAGLEGEDIPLETRIAVVARDTDLFARSGQDPHEILQARRGSAYDPDVVDVIDRIRPEYREAEWADVMEAEPRPSKQVEDIDRALEAVADYVDLKSPWTRGHSPRVAELAETAARSAGLDDSDRRSLRRAGLVHDLGRVGVPSGIWDKPGPLATAEWEEVRLHPYLTDRVLSRCESLAGLSELASSHHERADGSGYHRRLAHEQITALARFLAASDVMAALTSDRPHRGAMGLDEAAQVIKTEVAEGRLDGEAAARVLEAAGAEEKLPREGNPGGLTDREVEVLCLIAKGRTNRQVGDELFISTKTVGRHVENIYAKIDVSTRAGAALYAMEHRLLR
ncbi:MAG TPA: HD domain-containing phosphohydrolase [Acidimicrobiia bacterium]|nr:HD domain-containing phosphohydrolase [Acidimicrobiia bacterium]